jgi:hypothetical protein
MHESTSLVFKHYRYIGRNRQHEAVFISADDSGYGDFYLSRQACELQLSELREKSYPHEETKHAVDNWPTKASILAKANAAFPNHYAWLLEHEPAMPLPEHMLFPTVESVAVENIQHMFGSVAGIEITVRLQSGNVCRYSGVYSNIGADAVCMFTETSRELRLFLRLFAENLFFNILPELDGAGDDTVAFWRDLPEV